MTVMTQLAWAVLTLAAAPVVASAAPPQAVAGPPLYRSTLADYRAYAEGEIGDWRAANASVAGSQGHSGHAGHAMPDAGGAGHAHPSSEHDHGGLHP